MKRILIISGALQVGGAERVCANISEYAPEGEFEFHYVVFEGIPNVYGPEIEKRGGKVFTLPSPSKGYSEYAARLGKLMDEYDYAAVHSHTMFNSGINLMVAKKHGVPIRIAHAHTTAHESRVSLIQRMYEKTMHNLIADNATSFLACGVDAGKWLYGEKEFNEKGQVVYNGIDTDTFAYNEKAGKEIRKKYGIEDSLVIGHSGTLAAVKNQEFLISLMPEILEKRQDAVLMLMGRDSGNEVEKLSQLAKELGVYDHVIFTGGVMNPYDYLSAFDVFAFPSLREGTPLALIEAQTNGLPCIVSDKVPDDAFITNLAVKASLDDEKLWTSLLLNSSRNPKVDGAESVKKAGYSIKTSLDTIYTLYRGEEKNKEEKEDALMGILNSFIHESQYHVPDGFSLLDTAMTASINSVMGIMGKVLAEADQPIDKLYVSAVSESAFFEERKKKMDELSQVLSERGIDHLFFKGFVLKRYYPSEFLRTYGDIDFLIRKEDRNITDDIMIELGFERGHDWEPVYSYRRGNEFYEIHTQVLDTNISDSISIRQEYDNLLDSDKCIRIREYVYEMKPEYHFIYVLAHIAKHLKGSGAGIRMYMDVALFIKNEDNVDWEYVKEELKRLGLYRFATVILDCVEQWFGISSPFETGKENNEFAREFLIYTLNGGTFGSDENRNVNEAVKSGKRDSRIGIVKNYVFCPVDELKVRYVYLEKRPWLLPVAWVHRTYNNRQRLFEAIKFTKAVISTDMSDIDRAESLFEKLGLN